MANILDYIRWRGDLPFSVSPLNRVDNVIFTQLAYLDFSGIAENEAITIADAGEKFFALYRHQQTNTGHLAKEEYFELLHLCMNSTRFSQLLLHDYVKKVNLKLS